jgi:hypothetical protein
MLEAIGIVTLFAESGPFDKYNRQSIGRPKIMKITPATSNMRLILTCEKSQLQKKDFRFVLGASSLRTSP